MKPRNNPFLCSAAVQTLRIQVAVAVALGLAAISTPLLRAANTWNGGGGGTFLWSNNANWSGAQPTFGTLTYAGALGNTNIMDQSYSMNGLNVTSVGPWTMNVSNSAVLSLFDNGGTQAKVENNGGGLLTLNIPITFAATAGNNWGEINAVTGSITFGTGALTVSGTGVNGIRMFGGSGAIATTFNNTVSASGKYFATNSVNQTINIGGAFTSGNFFLMNGGTLKLNTGGTLTTSGGSAEALRLGGDFGTTGSQNLASGATFQLTPLTGGLTTNALINTVANNTSGALLIDSLNTSNTNTLAGDFYLDSNLRVNQASGGTIIISDATGSIKD